MIYDIREYSSLVLLLDILEHSVFIIVISAEVRISALKVVTSVTIVTFF